MKIYKLSIWLLCLFATPLLSAQADEQASIFKVTPASSTYASDGSIEIVLSNLASRDLKIKVLQVYPPGVIAESILGVQGRVIANLRAGRYLFEITEGGECTTCFIRTFVEVGVQEEDPGDPPCDPIIDPNCAQDPCDVATGEGCDTTPPCDPETDPDCPGDCTDCDCPPGDPNCHQVPIRAAFDPNDIQGPKGYGPERWVAGDKPMRYKILYENDPDFATASARNVLIDHTFSDLINPQSFELGDFGFGGFSFPVPRNLSYYKELVDVSASLDLKVDFTGGVNVVQQSSFWRMLSIDPDNGLPPVDADAGYLLVNDSIGSGEGYVTFSVKAKPSVETGDTIFAQANIVFDDLEPVITPVYFNIIDANAPVSEILSATIGTDSLITLNVAASDIGSGLAFYELYVSVDGSPFRQVGTGTPDITELYYRGVIGKNTRFITIAQDQVGNREQKDLGADATLVIEPKMIELLSPVSETQACIEDVLLIQWEATNSVNLVDLLLSFDNGVSYNLIAPSIPAGQGTYNYPIPLSTGNQANAKVKIIDSEAADVVNESAAFAITDSPTPCATCDDITMTLDEDPIASKLYKAGESISSAGRVAAASYVRFRAADRIVLRPGFRVEVGAFFLATIGDCVPETTLLVPPVAEVERSVSESQLQIIPNPFTLATTIRYQLPAAGWVTLTITDAMGRVVGRVGDARPIERGAGVHEVRFSAQGLVSGVYGVHLEYERAESEMPAQRVIERMVIIK